jgi:hypothetical protein
VPGIGRRVGWLGWLVVPLLVSCAPPLECNRSSGDVWCMVSGWQRSNPLAHRACTLLGGPSTGMQNELGQSIGDSHCEVELWIQRKILLRTVFALVALLVVLRLRRRFR